MKKSTYVVWLGLIVLLLGTLLYMGYLTEKENAEYKNFELELEEATSIYITSYPFSLKNGETGEIEVSDLLDAGLIDSNKVGNDECSGIIYITNHSSEYEYSAVISCNNYETNIK